MLACKDAIKESHIKNMNFQEAIRKIEERGDFNQYVELKPTFESRLHELKVGDHIDRGICYYYLLISYLKAQLVGETEESLEFYEKMDRSFKLHEKALHSDKEKRYQREIEDFYRLMEKCYGTLERVYSKKSFNTTKLNAYIRKMEYRKKSYVFKRNLWKYFEYKFLEVTSNYGISLFRWLLVILFFSILMAAAFAYSDFIAPEGMKMLTGREHWFNYYYHSMVTLTTLGYGDYLPFTFLAKIITMVEVFFGYVMLGIFIGLLQKRLTS